MQSFIFWFVLILDLEVTEITSCLQTNKRSPPDGLGSIHATSSSQNQERCELLTHLYSVRDYQKPMLFTPSFSPTCVLDLWTPCKQRSYGNVEKNSRQIEVNIYGANCTLWNGTSLCEMHLFIHNCLVFLMSHLVSLPL